MFAPALFCQSCSVFLCFVCLALFGLSFSHPSVLPCSVRLPRFGLSTLVWSLVCLALFFLSSSVLSAFLHSGCLPLYRSSSVCLPGCLNQPFLLGFSHRPPLSLNLYLSSSPSFYLSVILSTFVILLGLTSSLPVFLFLSICLSPFVCLSSLVL